MNMEDVLELIVRETTPQRVLYTASTLLVLAFIHSIWVQWKLNAPKREQAKMDREREKAARKCAAGHIFGALQYAVKDGELTAEEAALFIREIGKRSLPDLLPEGTTLKEELLAKKGEVTATASSVLSLMKLKLS